jgi:uncharacterized secreted protein with C-terminal beta-propeller domain
MNPAVFDAVMTAIARHIDDLPTDLRDRFDKLIDSKDFTENSSFRTTDVDAVRGRLELAEEFLVGTK